MDMNLKPKKRSKLRLKLGKAYYTYKRYLRWYLSNQRFSSLSNHKLDTSFPYSYITHETPLIRNLKNVDMYLQYNKIINLKLATKCIDGLIINPGETFSYWKLIGKPTKQKGYKDGMILFCGSVKEGIGGGLCQLSNLLYWMFLHTPLTVIERYRHSYDVFPDSNRILPFGSGATCTYNYRDLIIKNETSNSFLINLTVTDNMLVGNILSNIPPSFTYGVYEKEHYIKREYWGAYSRHNTLRRKIYDMSSNEVGDEFITENHALMMYEPLLTDSIMR